jgi:hypothetical protein
MHKTKSDEELFDNIRKCLRRGLECGYNEEERNRYREAISDLDRLREAQHKPSGQEEWKFEFTDTIHPRGYIYLGSTPIHPRTIPFDIATQIIFAHNASLGKPSGATRKRTDGQLKCKKDGLPIWACHNLEHKK